MRCWRCTIFELAAFVAGVFVGLPRALIEARGDLGLAWDFWQAWYVPFAVHPWDYGMHCRHGVPPNGEEAPPTD